MNRGIRIFIATLSSFQWSEDMRDSYRKLARHDCRRVHRLTDSLDEADVILIVDLHQHPSDWSLRTLYRHPLVRKYGDKIFVYDERDHPWCSWPGIYVSMPKSGFETSRQRAYSFPFLKNELLHSPAVSSDWLFSFMGGVSHKVRRKILALRHPRGLVEDTHFSFFDAYSQAGTTQYQDRACALKARYAEIIGRSKFVLCPRGQGYASFRLFETLAAGRVPVIVSDEWTEPAGPDWNACSLRVRESEVGTIPQILEQCEADFPRLAAQAARTYQEWFAPEIIFHRIGECCADLLEHGRLGRRPGYLFTSPYLTAACCNYWGRFRVHGGRLIRKARARLKN